MSSSIDSVEDVLATLGVEVHSAGTTQIKGICPMHEVRTGKPDAHPSWYINKITGASFCHSCHYAASLAHLVTDLTGSDSHSFLRAYRTAAIVRLAKESKTTVAELAPAPDKTYVGEGVLAKLAAPPTRLLERRGLQGDSAALYGLRWNKDGKHWVIPVRNALGDLIGWQEKAHGYFKNVPTGMKKSQCLFGLDVFAGGRAILVESPLDVVRLHSLGIRGGLSSYGSMVSNAQMALIIASSTKLLVALDNDKAGREGAKRLLDAYKRRIPLSFLCYRHTREKDIGDMTTDHVKLAIEKASLLEGPR